MDPANRRSLLPLRDADRLLRVQRRQGGGDLKVASPAAPTPAITAPSPPRAPAAHLANGTDVRRRLTNGRDVGWCRYRRPRAYKRQPGGNNRSKHD
jgi:hypothetical protein